MSDQLAHLLFESPGRKLVNIKFMRGSRPATAPEFRAAVTKVVFNIENELVEGRSSFGDKGRKTIDVAKLVGTL